MTQKVKKEKLLPRGDKNHPDNKKKSTDKKPAEVKDDGNTNTNE